VVSEIILHSFGSTPQMIQVSFVILAESKRNGF